MKVTLIRWCDIHGVQIATARNWFRCGMLRTATPAVPVMVDEDESPPVTLRGRPRKEEATDDGQ